VELISDGFSGALWYFPWSGTHRWYSCLDGDRIGFIL